jgi:hypothetical protein
LLNVSFFQPFCSLFLFTLIWVLEVFFSCNDSSSPTYFPYWDYNFANFENNQLELETDWTEQENNSVLFQRRDHVSAEGFRQIFSIITFSFLSLLTLSFHFFCSLSVRLLVLFLILHFRKSFVCISYSYVCRLFISIFFYYAFFLFLFFFGINVRKISQPCKSSALKIRQIEKIKKWYKPNFRNSIQLLF